MQLVEEGALNLTDKVSDHLSDEVLSKLPNKEAFTIEHLLEHRSGLADAFEQDFILGFFNDPTKHYTFDELLNFVRGTKAVGAVNSTFYYSDANYILLSMLVQKLEGDYKQAIRNRIFLPLGMSDTYLIDTPEQTPAGVAASYWDRFGDGKLENITDIQLATTAGLEGTDGVISSTTDLHKFLVALFDGTLLGAEMVTNMTAIQEVPEAEQQRHGITGYGLGLMQVTIAGKVWFRHFGNHLGSGAIMLYCPENNRSIVAFTNTGTFFSDTLKPTFFGWMLWELEAIMAG